MTFLDLCAGIGGLSLGLTRAGMTCVGQVEIDDYCNKILRRHWPDVRRWRDITTLDPAELPRATLVAGGYPCQPFSVAGQRKGAGDDRHLWPFVFRIVAHHRPAWCLFENVAGHVSLGLDAVCSDLETIGYACGPLVVPACAVDAPHRRDRVWLLAHAGCAGWGASEPAGHVALWPDAGRPQASGGPGASGAHGRAGLLADAHGLGRLQGGAGATGRQRPPLPRRGGSSVANTEGLSLRARFRAQEEGGQRWGRSGDGRRPGGFPGGSADVFPGRSTSAGVSEQQRRSFTPEWRTWPAEPGVGRVAHGVPGRVDRLKGLGNAVVPQLAEMFGLAIMAAHDE